MQSDSLRILRSTSYPPEAGRGPVIACTKQSMVDREASVARAQGTYQRGSSSPVPRMVWVRDSRRFSTQVGMALVSLKHRLAQQADLVNCAARYPLSMPQICTKRGFFHGRSSKGQGLTGLLTHSRCRFLWFPLLPTSQNYSLNQDPLHSLPMAPGPWIVHVADDVRTPTTERLVRHV